MPAAVDEIRMHGVTDDDGNLLLGQRGDGSPIWNDADDPLPLQRVAHFTEFEARCKAWELAGAGYGPTGISQLHHSTQPKGASAQGQCLRDGVAESVLGTRNGNADWTKAGTGVNSPTSPGLISRKAYTGSVGSNPTAVAPPFSEQPTAKVAPLGATPCGHCDAPPGAEHSSSCPSGVGGKP